MLDKPSLLARFADIVGARHVIAEPTDMERYLVEDRGLYHGRALCVARWRPVRAMSFSMWIVWIASWRQMSISP